MRLEVFCFARKNLRVFQGHKTVSHFLEIFILSQDFWGNHVRDIMSVKSISFLYEI